MTTRAQPLTHIVQSGTIPWRLASDGSPEVLLITSSRGGRWVFPKGRIEAGATPESQAHCETWEEAGVRGTLILPAAGSFQFRKGGRSYSVQVFLLEVTTESDRWPECLWRQRRWMSIAEARARFSRPEARFLFDDALCWVEAIARREEALTG